MTKAAYAYVAILLGLAVGLVTLLPGGEVLHAHDLAGLATFGFLAFLSEALGTDFIVAPDRRVQSSILFVPIFAAAVVYSPATVGILVALVSLATQVIRRPAKAWLVLFNLAQHVVTFAGAAWLYYLLSHSLNDYESLKYVPFAGMASFYFLANVILVSALYALRGSAPWKQVVAQAIGPAGGNLLYDLMSSPLALLAAALYRHWSAGGLLIVALPLLLVRRSYISKLQLERINKDLLRVLVKAIETRDPHTSGHSVRVASSARSIARAMGLRKSLVDEVETAALLHDIGKIEALYAPVISKPYTLSSEERALIRTHAVKGADLLLSLSAFSDRVIRAVRHHHERFDGTGYPDGLAGPDIPLASRIIMVCDSVDAMLSDRPYRRALSQEAVESELRSCSYTQFDPAVVRVVLKEGTLSAFMTSRGETFPFALTAVAGK